MKKLGATGIIIFVVFLFTNHTSAQSAQFRTPKEACQYYQNRWEKGLIQVVNNTESECKVRVGDSNTGFGYIRVWSQPGKLCMDSSGAYFNNSGIPNSSKCYAVSGLPSNQQQQNNSENVITPSGFHITELQYDSLPKGKQVQAGDNERIEITMPDGSIIQLDSNATFTPVSGDEMRSALGRYRYVWPPFDQGKCLIGQNLVKQQYRKVTTQDAILEVKGAEFLAETDKSGTTITVLKGLLCATSLNGKKTVEVTAGQSTYIKHGGLPDDPKAFDSAKINRWWTKKTLEQNSFIYALIITGFILIIVILLQIKRRISGKKKPVAKV